MMSEMKAELFAPCGMNCRLCYAFIRDKKPCRGCNGTDEHKPYHCTVCQIKYCTELEESAVKLCYICKKFPCRRLKQLDKRYQEKYHMSMIENLKYIEQHGQDAFLSRELTRWACRDCGSVLCVHRETCPACGAFPFEQKAGEQESGREEK
jgi:hypothetical protein